jgi:hypothetical protein
MIDWADPMLDAQARLKVASNQLSLAGPVHDIHRDRMLGAAERELLQAHRNLARILEWIEAERNVIDYR